MGFTVFAKFRALSSGLGLGQDVNKATNAVEHGAGMAWGNRDQLLDAIVSSGAIAGGIAATGFGPLGVVAGAGAITSGAQGLYHSVKNMSSAREDPLFHRNHEKRKRKRDKIESQKAGAEGAHNIGSKVAKISGDMRSRLANIASMR